MKKTTLQATGVGVLISALGTFIGTLLVSATIYGIMVIAVIIGIALVIVPIFTSK